jgi:hypothetical protein
MIYITSEFEKINVDICDNLIKEFITNEKPKKNS